MKNRLIYSDFVKEDLKEIIDFHKEINPKLIRRFIQDFRDKIKFIQEQPLSLEITYDDIRIAFLKKVSGRYPL